MSALRMSSAESFNSLSWASSAMIFSWSGDLAPHFPLFTIVLKSSDVIMEGSVRNALKVSIEEYGVDIVNRLTVGLELGIVVVEVSVNLVDVAIFSDCIKSQLAEIDPECGNSCLAVEGGKPHDSFVHEWCDGFCFAIDNEFIVLTIGKQSCFGLLSEAVVQTAPHLLVVLCCSLV
eukprot:CCRYP_002935-RA/>CCRYP_002935-RA protein AED:0.21 eAED:0.21 QI:163/1/1/1/0.33/0/4/437/175